MPTIAVPRNWHEFQHYKTRNPPWVKLHRKLLNDRDFCSLPLEARALLPMLWLLAAEDLKGRFSCDLDDLNFQLRRPHLEILAGLRPLFDRGFLTLVEGDLLSLPMQPSLDLNSTDASGLLADRLHDATPETEKRQSRGESNDSPVQRAARAAPSSVRFNDFWNAYPRKVGKKVALEKWKAKGLDRFADAIVADLARRREHDEKWKEGYILNPATYLHQERWTDEGQERIATGATANTQGPSPAKVETPADKVQAEIDFCRQQIDLGAMTRAEANQRVKDLKVKLGVPAHG